MSEKMPRRLFLKLQSLIVIYGAGLSGCKGKPMKKSKNFDKNAPLVKISENLSPTVFGTPVILCGAKVNEKANFNVLGNFAMLSNLKEKPVIYISSHKSHYTNIGIHEHGEFSVNFPTEAIIPKADYCGVVSGSDVDKSTVFQIQYGSLVNAPLITECISCLGCRVIHKYSVHDMEIFFGEIIEHYTHPSVFTDGKPDYEKLELLKFGPANAFRTTSAIQEISLMKSSKTIEPVV